MTTPSESSAPSRRLLITGATGGIGLLLAERLSLSQWLAIACIMGASIGCTIAASASNSGRQGNHTPPDIPPGPSGQKAA